MQLTNYLARPVSELLGTFPFNTWHASRTIEDDLDEPIVEYIFEDHGMELRCDGNENLRAVFLFSKSYGGFDDSTLELRFSMTRKAVLMQLGAPAMSGKPMIDPILGDYGAWDRFEQPNDVVIHIEYCTNADQIEKITLMCAEDAP